jgi:hypothetical protein
MNCKFDNEVSLNEHAIPFFIREVNGVEYKYVFAHGNRRFQCRELESAMSDLDDCRLIYYLSQYNKKNKDYYAKFMGVFDIEEKQYFFMKIFFDNSAEKNWNTWLIPKEYTRRINDITRDFDVGNLGSSHIEKPVGFP